MRLTAKQSTAYLNLIDRKTNKVLFGGGAGGGKSLLGCFWITKCCLTYPETRWLVGRAILKTLKETTLNTLFDLFKLQGIQKDVHYKLNFGTNTITFSNGSQILLKDLFAYPSDPNFDELGSLEITGAFVDEANQINEKCKDILYSRIRYKLTDYNLIPKILYTCNPAKNWTYLDFYKPHKENKLDNNLAFIQSLVYDNPHISKHYIESLQSLDRVNKERLLLGNWEYDDDPSKLIEYDNILNLFTNTFVEDGKKFITCDVARYGSDSTVILVWSGMRVIQYYQLHESSIADTANKIKSIAHDNKIPLSQIVVDEDGVGGGVVDILKCKGFVNNSKVLNGENYTNLKSQCYYKLADAINDNKISWLNVDEKTKHNVIEELEVVKAKDIDKDGKLAVMPKEKVKELINRSPDIADALMMRMYFEIKKGTSVRTRKY